MAISPSTSHTLVKYTTCTYDRAMLSYVSLPSVTGNVCSVSLTAKLPGCLAATLYFTGQF